MVRWWQTALESDPGHPDLARIKVKTPCTHDDLRVWFRDDAGSVVTYYGRCVTCLDTVVRTIRFHAETRDEAVEDRPMTEVELTRYRRIEPQ